MSGVLYLAYVLEFVINGLDDGAFPEQYFVIEVHHRVFHVPLEFGDQVYVIDEEHLKEVLADVPPVCEELAEELLGEPPVLQRLPVIDIARSELPPDDLAPVVDDQVQLETIEPAHRALALGRPPPHRLVLLLALDVVGDQRRGVYDGYARALAQGACLQEQQQVEGNLSLTLHETVVGDGVWELIAHVLAYVTEIKRLEVTEMTCVEQNEYGHDLAVGHA